MDFKSIIQNLPDNRGAGRFLFFVKDFYYYFYFKYSYVKFNLMGVRNEPTCRLHPNAKLSANVSLFGRTIVNHDVTINSYTYATDAIIQNALIGKFCSIAPGAKIGLNEHPLNELLLHPFGYDAKSHDSTLARVLIGNDVWIAANVVILNGIKVGNGCVIAAGAIVTKDVPDFAIVAGIPAKIVSYRQKHKDFDGLMNSLETIL